MTLVHTAFGPGQIVEEDVVRGRRSFLVEGSGFKKWIDEADAQIHVAMPVPRGTDPDFRPRSEGGPHGDIYYGDGDWFSDYGMEPDEEDRARWAELTRQRDQRIQEYIDNTGLDPYVPEWQAREEKARRERRGAIDDPPTDLGDRAKTNKGLRGRLPDEGANLPYDPTPQFPVDGFRTEQTIQPDHVLDADERTSPSNSLTFKRGPKGRWPAPGPHLFSKPASRKAGCDWPPEYDRPDEEREWDPREDEAMAQDYLEAQAWEEGHRRQHPDQWKRQPGRWEFTGSAGLSDKYIEVEAAVDHYHDPIQQFRDDPQGYIQRQGYLNSDSHNIRMAEYAELVESDPMLRQAAWNDVRRKAQRLRRNGKVEVKEASTNRIMATVRGDTGDHEVMILTGGYGGLGRGGASISDWHCDCDWGQWAFRRQAMYIGRLCSHGYATYLELMARQMANEPRKAPYKSRKKTSGVLEEFKKWVDEHHNGHLDLPVAQEFLAEVNADEEEAQQIYDYVDDHEVEGVERDFEVPYTEDVDEVYKEAAKEDVLQTRPGRMAPVFTFVEDEDGQHFTDVEKDDRKTTGPDEILHFSSRHYAEDVKVDGMGQQEIPPYRDYEGGGELLKELREKGAKDPSDDFGRMDERNDEIREIVEELHEKGYDADQFVASRHHAQMPVGPGTAPNVMAPGLQTMMKQTKPRRPRTTEIVQPQNTWGSNTIQPTRTAFMREPYEGSGGHQRDWIGTSEDYVNEHEKPRYEDLTEQPDDDIIKYTENDHPPQGPGQKQGGRFTDDDIASQAQGFLRTAGRNFSMAEQRALEDEEHHLGARNLDGLDLSGTHYEDDEF